jgi:hypothetical protein
MLAENFLGRIREARDTLLLVEECGHSLDEDAYQMACFSARLGEFEYALHWLLIDFNRSSTYYARSFWDTDLNPFWEWLRNFNPALKDAHRILLTPFKTVVAAVYAQGRNLELSIEDLQHLPEAQKNLFRYDHREGAYFPYPLAIERDPAAMDDLMSDMKARYEWIEGCIRNVHQTATTTVLDMQPNYAAEHAARGNHLGARYHILWGTSLRPALIVDFLNHPGLGLMRGFMEELLLANHENPGFGQRMHEAAECMEQNPDQAWRLMEETPEAQRRTALFKARLASLHNAYEEYEVALPLWEELRRLWPHDVLGYSGAIDALLKLGRREEAAALLASAPPCYRRFAIYWWQLAEIEGGTPRYCAFGRPHFRGQPDLGAKLIPEEAMEAEDRPAAH